MLHYASYTILSAAIFYGYYYFFLRNQRLLAFNRIYLVAILGLSLVIPLLDIPIVVNTTQIPPATLPAITAAEAIEVAPIVQNMPTPTTVNWDDVVLMIYLAMVMLFLIRMTKAIVNIYQIKIQHSSEKIGNILLIKTQHPHAPFSFFQWLFWNNRISLETLQGAAIFKHEWFHIRQRHSWELLGAELILIGCWFNPFFYWIRNEIKTNHEFLADAHACEDQGSDAYAQLLLIQAIQVHRHHLIHPFFQPQLKRRIMMLTNPKKPIFPLLKKLMAVPIIGIVLAMFGFSYQNAEPLIAKTFPAKSQQPQIAPSPSLATSPQKKSSPNSPLYFLNGKASSRDIVEKIPTNNILNLKQLESNEAIEKYGIQAKLGAIEIITKMPLEPRLLTHPAAALPEVVITSFGDGTETSPSSKPSPSLLPYSLPKEKEPIYTNVDIPPTYLEDGKGWTYFLERNIRGLNGKEVHLGTYRVTVQFIVERNGSISHIQALSRAGFGAEAEVIRVINRSKAWTPAKKNDRAVRSIQRQDIRFEVVAVKKKEAEHSEEIFTKVERNPSFPGGATAWSDFLVKNLNHAVAVQNNAPAGNHTTIIQFVVDTAGVVSNAKIIQDPGYGIGAEGLRMILASGKWIPAIQNNRRVKSFKKQPITIQIN